MIYSLQSSFELIERDTHMNSYLLVIILLCFAFVGVARVAQPDLIAQTFTGFFKIKRPDSNGFEGSKLQPSMAALIVLNYIVSFATCVFLLLNKNENLPAKIISETVAAVVNQDAKGYEKGKV